MIVHLRKKKVAKKEQNELFVEKKLGDGRRIFRRKKIPCDTKNNDKAP